MPHRDTTPPTVSFVAPALAARATDEATASIQVVVAAVEPDLRRWNDAGPTLPPPGELPAGGNTLQGGCAVAGTPATTPPLLVIALWVLFRPRRRI